MFSQYFLSTYTRTNQAHTFTPQVQAPHHPNTNTPNFAPHSTAPLERTSTNTQQNFAPQNFAPQRTTAQRTTPQAGLNTNTNSIPTTTNEPRNPNRLLALQFTEEEVKGILNGVDVNKKVNKMASRTHSSRTLLHPPHLAIPLRIIFKRSLGMGIFPRQFKLVNVTPILKKGAMNNVENYRPICILNSFSKIFEKLVHDNALEFLNDFSA